MTERIETVDVMIEDFDNIVSTELTEKRPRASMSANTTNKLAPGDY